jgi:hypothetical protein
MLTAALLQDLEA